MYIAYMHVYILCVIDVFSAVFGVIIGDHDSNSYHAQADCGHAFLGQFTTICHSPYNCSL